jgi:hypothetical protein
VFFSLFTGMPMVRSRTFWTKSNTIRGLHVEIME